MSLESGDTAVPAVREIGVAVCDRIGVVAVCVAA